MVPGAWKVFALVLVLVGVLEGATQWGINNKIIKIVFIMQQFKNKGYYWLQEVVLRVIKNSSPDLYA